MARKRYPSDEKRLSRPQGVVVAFSIINPDPDHPEHSEVFGDPELRGIWLGLLAVAGQAYAGRTGDRVTLSLGQLLWITGRGTRSAGESALAQVCAYMGYEVTSHSGRSWTVHVKNLSRNQGWTPRNSANSVEDSADSAPPPSPNPNSSSSKTQKKNSARKRAAPSPAHFGIRAFCEEYTKARGGSITVPPQDKRPLGEVFADLGEERFREVCRAFFAMEDPWIAERAYSPRAFLQALPKATLRSQRPAPRIVTPFTAAQRAEAIALFGGDE